MVGYLDIEIVRDKTLERTVIVVRDVQLFRVINPFKAAQFIDDLIPFCAAQIPVCFHERFDCSFNVAHDEEIKKTVNRLRIGHNADTTGNDNGFFAGSFSRECMY